VTNALTDTLLASESSALRRPDQVAGVATAQRALLAQLNLVQLATDRSITLTSRNSPIPVTVQSSAPYTVRAWLTLSSDKLVFHPSHKQMVIDRATNPVRIQAVARTSGVIPVDVTLTTPRFNLQIAHGQLTVRSTATSLVGIVLTALALAVLLGWWARTWWRGRTRRAQAARDAPTSSVHA
jgi:hypothetical protein